MDFPVRHVAEKPGVSVQRIRAVTAAITGCDGTMIRVRTEVALVIRKIKHRHAFGEKRRVPHLDGLAGNDLDAARADTIRRLLVIIRRYKRTLRRVNAVASDLREKHRVPHLDGLAGNDLDAARAVTIRRLLVIIRRYKRTLRRVNAVAA